MGPKITPGLFCIILSVTLVGFAQTTEILANEAEINGLLEELQSNLDEETGLLDVAADVKPKILAIPLDALLTFLRRTLKEEKKETRRMGAILALGLLGQKALPEMMIGIRLANTRLASWTDLVGQFRAAHAAGVSSAIRPTGKSPNPGSTEPR